MQKLLVVVALLAAGQAEAEDAWSKEPTAYRGVEWGSSYEAAEEKLITGPRSVPIKCVCHADNGAPVMCVAILNPAGMRCTSGFSIDTVRITDAFSFDRDAFAAAQMEFDSDAYGFLKDIFIEKYGQPHKLESTTFKTLGGLEAQNESLAWTGARVVIQLSRYGDSITRGSATISTTAHIKILAEREERTKKNGAGAF